MNNTPWENPFADLEELFNQLRTHGRIGLESPLGDGLSLDVADNDDEIVVTADIAGYNESDIDVTVDGRTLSIHAERHVEYGDETDVLQQERRTQATRTVPLPVRVDGESATAEYTNGILTITLPKLDDESGTRIDVE